MRLERAPWPALQRKSSHVAVKLVALVLLFGASFNLLFPSSSSRSASPLVSRVPDSPSRDASTAVAAGVARPRREKCNLFAGEWIPNPSGPSYTNESCRFIESPQNCMRNGRPDTVYLFWRWKPHSCDVPPFNAQKFLDVMKNRSWALIGDSILRNHAQSLICLLSKAEEPVEVYHDDQFKSRRWLFPSHNFTISLIWSPFLIKAEIFENDDGESTSENRIHIDTLDRKWTSQYSSFDYIVISAGQWFLKTAVYVESGKVIGCHYCPKLNISEIGVEYAYTKTLNSLFRFVAASEHKPVVIYRTWTPDHFENGEWFSGGTCNRTAPYKTGEFDGGASDRVMRRIELDSFDRAAAISAAKRTGAKMMLLDTFQLSLLRPDAHSGPYRTFHPFEKDKNAKVQTDCLHWCLPGAIDTWNDLIMELVLNG